MVTKVEREKAALAKAEAAVAEKKKLIAKLEAEELEKKASTRRSRKLARPMLLRSWKPQEGSSQRPQSNGFKAADCHLSFARIRRPSRSARQGFDAPDAPLNATRETRAPFTMKRAPLQHKNGRPRR